MQSERESIKRLVNSVSLIQIFSEVKEEKEKIDEVSSEGDESISNEQNGLMKSTS